MCGGLFKPFSSLLGPVGSIFGVGQGDSSSGNSGFLSNFLASAIAQMQQKQATEAAAAASAAAEPPKQLLSPEEAARRKEATTGSVRQSSRNPLRISTVGTGYEGSGLSAPQ